MWTFLLAKLGSFLPVVVVLLAGVLGGVSLDRLAFRDPPVQCPQCPACHCPEPAVSVQPFEMEKMKGVKEFNYMPEFTGNISVAGVDSTMIKKYLDEAVRKYCLDLNNSKRKKR